MADLESARLEELLFPILLIHRPMDFVAFSSIFQGVKKIEEDEEQAKPNANDP